MPSWWSSTVTQIEELLDAIVLKHPLVQLMREQNLTVAQVCKDLNLVDSAVRRWLLEFGAPQECPQALTARHP